MIDNPEKTAILIAKLKALLPIEAGLPNLIYSPAGFLARCVSADVRYLPERRMGPKRLSHRGFTGWAALMGGVC